MNIFEAENYREFLQSCIEADKNAGKRGPIKKLANHLKCHSTYVSQVLNGKADFSPDQAVAVCEYYRLAEEQEEFFMDLLQRDRAGTKATRDHYNRRLQRRLTDRQNIKKRWQVEDALTPKQQEVYYRSWIPQAVHLCCQLPSVRTVEFICERLDLNPQIVENTLRDLEEIGFVERTATGFKSLRDSVYLGKDTSIIGRYHTNWRLKAIQDFTSRSQQPGTHFSSVISTSSKAADQIRDLLLSEIDSMRDIVVPSQPRDLWIFNLDFYPLNRQN